MRLIIPISFVRYELEPVGKIFPLTSIIKAAKKAKMGLGIPIGKAPKGACFSKISITSKSGVGRTLFMVRTKDEKIIPLLIRTKKDKVGYNMTPKNKLFSAALDKNLLRTYNDLKKKKYEVIEI